MEFLALKFSAGTTPAVGSQCTPSLDTPGQVRALADTGCPAVYVVRESDLDRFRAFPALVRDCGEKDPRSGLARSMLRPAQGIPIIGAGYSALRSMKASVRALLERAVNRGKGTACIVGVSSAMFELAWTDAGRTAQARRRGGARRERPSLATARTAAGNSVVADYLNETLPPVDLELIEGFATAYAGSSARLAHVRHMMAVAAGVSAPVLIVGDTGTGKTLIAKMIHESGDRGETFKQVNCGEFPAQLLESELFGHKKGAFTGALADREGLWEAAGTGTLFLDEIADLSIEHQAKILRAVEEGIIRRVGENEDRRVRARLITATNRDLSLMIAEGRFREDLYYRLCVIPIQTPALREHPEDIPQIAQVLWRKITGRPGKRLPDTVTTKLRNREWPGNARDLRAVLQLLFSVFGTDDLTADSIEDVFLLLGYAASPPVDAAVEDPITAYRIDCLRHLRESASAIRACKIAVRPILTGDTVCGDTVGLTLHALGCQVQELETLCEEPDLFHSDSAYTLVHRLKGQLTSFGEILAGDHIRARGFWSDHAGMHHDLALAGVLRELEYLTHRR